MSARLPRLLDSNMREVARVLPTTMSLTLDFEGLSTAQITLTEDAPAVHMRDWFELYSPNGSAGYFRVTDIDDNKRQEIALTLTIGLDTLRDSVWRNQEDYDGTVEDFVTQALSYQNVPYWQLGICEDDGAWKKSGINYDHISDLLAEVRTEREGYYFDLDFTTSPWTLNIRARNNAVVSEFRLARNMESCRINRTDAELCNRLHLSINQKITENDVTTTETEFKTYDDAASQAVYGVVERTADIDLEDVPDADEWAAKFLAHRARPIVQIDIDGYALKAITGEAWDEAKLGRVSRVALPDYGETLEERVVSLTYPELRFGDDGGADRVTVALANRLAKFSETLAKVDEKAEKAAKGAKGAGRGGASAEEMKTWAQIVKWDDEKLKESGIWDMVEHGIVIDADAGITIYSIAEGIAALHSAITVNRDDIALVIDHNGQTASIKIGAITNAINGSTSTGVYIDADKIILNGDVIATAINANKATIEDLMAGRTVASKIYANTVQVAASGRLQLDSNSSFAMHALPVSWQDDVVVDGVSSPGTSGEYYIVYANNNDINDLRTIRGRVVTSNGSAPTTKTLHYLGRAAT